MGVFLDLHSCDSNPPHERCARPASETLGSSYALERELGGGGMSRVFVANEVRLDRKVVVKVLSPDLAAGLSAERFEEVQKYVAEIRQRLARLRDVEKR